MLWRETFSAVIFLCLLNEATAKVDAAMRNQILNLHNSYREIAAKGQVKNRLHQLQPMAKNMRRLTWDDDLQRIAQNWANDCHFDHSHNGLGENIVMDSAKNVSSMIGKWFEEIYSGKVTSYDNYSVRDLKTLGHYTQMIWATTNKIGCGYNGQCKMRYRGKFYEMALIVCNYFPPGNVMRRPIFKKGVPCTGCGEREFCDATSMLCI